MSKVKDLREAKGLSTADLSRRTNLTPSYLSHIESGRRVPSRRVLDVLCAELDATVEELGFQLEVVEHVRAISRYP